MPRWITTVTLALVAALAAWTAPQLVPTAEPVPVAPSNTANPTRPPPSPVQASRVVVLDVSGSMGERSKLSYAKLAVRHLAQRLGPNERLTVVTFADRATIIVDPSESLSDSQLAQRLEGVHFAGSSNLYAGLEVAQRLAGRGASVLVVSDGRANAGVTEPERAVTLVSAMQQDGATVSTLSLGDDAVATLSAMARAGGGQHTRVVRPSQLVDLFVLPLSTADDKEL